MPRLQKITRAPAPAPSRLYRALTLPGRLVQKAFSMLSIHSSSWFLGLSSHWGGRAYQELAQAAMTNAVAYRSYRLISDTMSSVVLFAATEVSDEAASKLRKIDLQIESIMKGAITRRIKEHEEGTALPLLLTGQEKSRIKSLKALHGDLMTLAQTEKAKHVETVLIKEPDHPFIEVLRRPNDEEPSYQNFIMRIVADLFFGGEVFFYTPGSALDGPHQGLPTDEGFFTIRPDRFTRFERDRETGKITFYHWIANDGKTKQTPAACIQHIKMPDPRRAVGGHVGFSTNLDHEERGYPIALAIWQELQLVEAGNDWNNSVFKNRGRVPGFFKYKGGGKFTETQFKRTKEAMQEAFQSDTENSRAGLLDGDWDFLENNISQRDADWLRGVQQYMKWIAVALGVDPALVGDQGSRTLANLSIAVRSLYTLTVLPLLDWIVDEWNARYMVKYTGDARLFVDREGIDALQEDRTLVIERAVKAAGVPVATREEARAMASLGAEADGTFFVPTTVVEAADAGGEGSAHLEENNGNKGRRKNLIDMGKEELFQHVLTLIPNGEDV